jgi:hypothetical protein
MEKIGSLPRQKRSLLRRLRQCSPRRSDWMTFSRRRPGVRLRHRPSKEDRVPLEKNGRQLREADARGTARRIEEDNEAEARWFCGETRIICEFFATRIEFHSKSELRGARRNNFASAIIVSNSSSVNVVGRSCFDAPPSFGGAAIFGIEQTPFVQRLAYSRRPETAPVL